MTFKADVQSKLDALYTTSEDFTVNQVDREKSVRAQEAELLTLFDQAENDESISKSLLLFWRGKQLNLADDYNKGAEAFLSKAVKLEPTLIDAWNSLGNCFCKKRDMKSAKNCFTQAIRLKKNKISLRDLSMVLRSPLLGEAKDRRDNVNEGAKKAKEALALDMGDGRSWYVLGNAYLTQFFIIAQDESTLQNALKAYTKAEALGDTIPDLYYNRANVHRYQEDYAAAVKDYTTATKLDPTLSGGDAVDAITRLVTKVSTLVQTKSGLKAKKLDAMVATIPQEEKVGDKAVCNINDLALGANETKTLFVRVVSPVNKETDIPVSMIVCDQNKRFCAVSLYNVAPSFLNFVKVGDLLQLISPTCKSISLPESKGPAYPCLHMFLPDRVAVNGTPLDKKFYAVAQIVNENK